MSLRAHKPAGGTAAFGAKAAEMVVAALDGASEGTSFLGEPGRSLEKATMQQLQAPLNRAAAAALLAERQVADAWSRERERQSVAASLALEAELGIATGIEAGDDSGVLSSSNVSELSDASTATKASRRRKRKAQGASAAQLLADTYRGEERD